MIIRLQPPGIAIRAKTGQSTSEAASPSAERVCCGSVLRNRLARLPWCRCSADPAFQSVVSAWKTGRVLLEPEKTLFVRGATPVLLMSETPVHGALPALIAPDGAVPQCDGWSIVPKLTMCVVDGPGEAGLMIPALVAPVIDVVGESAEPGEMADWCADAERAGGAIVLSLDELPEALDWTNLLGSGAAHGGFMPSMA
ncbi:hypothetical protein AB0B15_42475 [Streptomyces sp. NPDC045456]|uniref:hypothetical protein n=1 Tax=Streptomyces sp. NPDC045456 TaxID=3155254 RepID=UPI0033FD288E